MTPSTASAVEHDPVPAPRTAITLITPGSENAFAVGRRSRGDRLPAAS